MSILKNPTSGRLSIRTIQWTLSFPVYPFTTWQIPKKKTCLTIFTPGWLWREYSPFRTSFAEKRIRYTRNTWRRGNKSLSSMECPKKSGTYGWNINPIMITIQRCLSRCSGWKIPALRWLIARGGISYGQLFKPVNNNLLVPYRKLNMIKLPLQNFLTVPLGEPSDTLFELEN